MGRLQDKLAVITGAANGLGEAIATKFAAEGARLALLDIDEAGLGRVAAALKAKGAKVWSDVGDVTEEKVVVSAFDRIVRDCGEVDVLVNDVGGSRNARIWEMSIEDWDYTIRLNLRSMFLCTRAVLPSMLARKAGSIVCLSSGARNGTPWTAATTGGAAYCAAKGGVSGFVRDVAMEVSHLGPRINAVAPGPIETERNRDNFARMGQSLDLAPQRIVPMKRLGQPFEIADAALFLASDEASYITGVTLDVAGGR